ncbi:hypothetical protein D3875_00440 [Deinococcus cavernae]|uniref:Solute-binding protein family 3/N-terminal domain-containing protein n=1 Tax=Deinococcus cavernae TaxID=2320857 RepID=A0A418VIH5_9DEIO|nr:transporter substrate-binding domain-containing protein [Deinococcus cavernae]RJF69142.1 hypothetical protein D3875_22780 [Deinococcus cavernae]RJF75926.1 hypothetical protein D3875_00405 [Deinococcus cavernae]RJF75930.1 hypothetical protein D3875_00440 [Deinococcus cavernae]
MNFPRLSRARFLFGALALLAAGFADARNLTEIRSSKLLVIGINGEIAPFQYTVDRKPMGFEIELMKMVAADLGVEPLYQVYPSFLDMQKALSEDRIDVFIGTLAATSNRDAKFDLTRPYACLAAALFTPEPNIRTHNDLKGKTVGLIKGTVFQNYVEKLPFTMNLKYYDSVAEVIEGLGKKFDATVAWKAQRPFMSKVTKLELQETPTLWSIPVSMMVSNGNTSLRSGLNASITKLRTDPKFIALDSRYFPNDSVICK